MTNENAIDSSFDTVFKLANEAIEQRKQQIAEGLNDYNLLTSVLKKHDEVRLHSRFIFSMLNPQGAHYRNTQFLEIFFDKVLKQTCNLEDVEVYREWSDGDENGGIDLFITDRNKFFIIENKIHAEDQHRQLARYVATIKKKYNLDNSQLAANVFVYYLSPRHRVPSKSSLGGFSLIGCNMLQYSPSETEGLNSRNMKTEKELNECLVGVITQYCNITYQQEILAWIRACLSKCCDSDNLKEAFITYEDVVCRVLNNRETSIMNTAKKLLENKNSSLLSQAREIEIAMTEVKGSILEDFFDTMSDSTLRKFPECKIFTPDQYKMREPFRHYNTENCRNWFNDKQPKRKYMGIIFEISPDISFCVIAATKHIHAGLLTKPEAMLDDIATGNKENRTIGISDTLKLTKRNWSQCPTWFSVEIIKEAFQFKEQAITQLIAEDQISTNQLFSTLYEIIDFGLRLSQKETVSTST